MEEFLGKKLEIREIDGIPGMLEITLPVHGDNRGWFKENWQREKMIALGLPDFNPVQQNVSFNYTRGATRGLHAEPWDKYVSALFGKFFGAWVDLRSGSTFGEVYTTEVDVSKGIYIPRGVANGYQALTDNVIYSYIVNDHWSPEARYTMLNLADPTISIDWPMDLKDAELSEKDKNHPFLEDITPFGA
jgi:dTDP-4-dehydrorhamnose 3,5-epimerase